MLLKGSFRIATNEENAWKFVSDPGKVIECVPGLQSYALEEGRRVSARVKVSIGLIRGTFQTSGRMVMEDPRAHAATIELTGSGAGSGFGATVSLKLAPAGEEVELEWNANVNISGPLGSLARPIIEGNAKKIIDQLFDCVKRRLS